VSRTELESRLALEGLIASAWENGPGERYAAHDHAYDKVLVVAAGGIRFGLPDAGRDVELAVGDRLDLPAGTTHDAVVGPSGVTCLEAHVPRGTLAAAPERRAAGTW
jgi:quercetin dioxygenase-like cupin family protein